MEAELYPIISNTPHQHRMNTSYEYIANFLNELEQMHISPSIHSTIDKHNSVLYKATVAF